MAPAACQANYTLAEPLVTSVHKIPVNDFSSATPDSFALRSWARGVTRSIELLESSTERIGHAKHDILVALLSRSTDPILSDR